MDKKEFVESHCEKGTTENEHELYWGYFKLGRDSNTVLVMTTSGNIVRQVIE